MYEAAKLWEKTMSANRLSLYWTYFFIMTVCAVIFAFLAISKIKIVRWEFFYPKQQKWAKKHADKLNLLVKKFKVQKLRKMVC